MVASEPPLAAGATDGFPDLYRRDNCGGEGYEALVQVAPNVEAKNFEPELQGTSADGEEAIFRVADKLTPDAASGVQQTYDASKGELHLLCILPSGTPYGGNCTAGTAKNGLSLSATELNRTASVTNAISGDGSRVYWTASEGEGGSGKVYLRENPGEEQSALSGGECIEAEKACTVKVSEAKSSKAARFLAASDNGSAALFEVTEGTLEAKLYEFTLGEGATEIAGKVVGLAGASEDLSHIYFVSEEVLPGTSGASAGKPNLYLSQEGTSSFIATLSATDVANAAKGNSIPSDTSLEPIYHAARASADGTRLAFVSTQSLGGYDNTDLLSGEADSEVYLYEAGATGPVCVSCDPSGARPRGRSVQGTGNGNSLSTAASIPAAVYQLYLSRALSADGQRLFFNSYDALLPRDTNGVEDVYEWESAASQAACAQKGADLYVEATGGCLSLISSGESPSDSEFLDASPDGHDAFFTTNASLLPQDPGLFDVYDARVGGGFAQPVAPAACEGEACQGPFSPPNDPTPGSASFLGAGNVKEAPARKKAHRKKHKRKKHAKQRGTHKQRTGR